MSELFWPGDERAGSLLTDAALVSAMVAVEQAWLDALASLGLADKVALAAPSPTDLAETAEAGGNPVIGLVPLLRAQSDWAHRGLTSQDVVDTGLMLCLRDTAERLGGELRSQAGSLVSLVTTHRTSLMAARTLTQYAVPTTFGLKAATWLTGVLDAADAVGALSFPAQLGGAAGTLSATAELPADPLLVPARAAVALDLEPTLPWHTSRRPVTAIGDALVAAVDAFGRIANDVATLSRPEVAELAELAESSTHTGYGASSTMPQKQNPVLAILIRRAAITAPGLAATLHTAAALASDERPDGAWHAEWATLRDLGRRSVVAASQTTDLLAGLRIDADRMAATAEAAWAKLTAERDAIAAFTGHEPQNDQYLGAADHIIDDVLARAAAFLEAPR